MIIFLDIDGVLNQLQANYYIDDACVKQLGILCGKLNATVVITSTWRIGFTHSYDRCTPQVKKLIDIFRKYNITIQSRTRVIPDSDRYAEIQEYVQRNSIKKYVILDDDRSLFQTGTEHLYLVNPSHGLRAGDVKKIVKMMKF